MDKEGILVIFVNKDEYYYRYDSPGPIYGEKVCSAEYDEIVEET